MSRFVDWKSTAHNLKLLRGDNINLRKFVCRALKFKDENCSGECDECKYDMDSSISQSELAEVFGVSTSVIANWETGRTEPTLDDLIFYSKMCKLNLKEVVIFKEDVEL